MYAQVADSSGCVKNRNVDHNALVDFHWFVSLGLQLPGP